MKKKDLSEECWRFGQQSRALQEARSSRIWDDQAARDINGKFLNPHKEESAKTQKHLEGQRSSLAEANEHLSEAKERGTKINECSEKIATLLQTAKQHVKKSYKHYEESRNLQDQTEELCTEVGDLLSQANSACS